ncbi:unnamed protein product [Caretta caretta]
MSVGGHNPPPHPTDMTPEQRLKRVRCVEVKHSSPQSSLPVSLSFLSHSSPNSCVCVCESERESFILHQAMEEKEQQQVPEFSVLLSLLTLSCTIEVFEILRREK